MNAAPARLPAKTRPFIVVLLTLMLIEGASIFEYAMILGALPFFAEHFQTDIVAISWTLTVFILVGAAASVVAGRLGDVYGRKRVLMVLLVLSILGSLISFGFGSLPAIIVGRALQGTSAGIIPLVMGIARETMPEKRVPVAVIVITATANLTAGAAVLIGGVYIDHGEWRLMFLTAAALGLLALALCWLVLPRPTADTAETETETGTVGIDWVGTLLLAPALISFLYGVTHANSAGILDPLVLATIGGGLAVLVFWGWWELRVPNPIVNLRYAANPKIVKILLVAACNGLGVVSVTGIVQPLMAQLPENMPIGVGMTATEYGAYHLVAAGVGFVLAPLAGRWAARFGGHIPFIMGGTLAIASTLLMVWGPLNQQLPVVVGVLVVTGVANAFLLGSLYSMLIDAVPAENTSEFVGLGQVVHNIMIAVGTVIGSSLVASSVIEGTTAPTTGAWQLTLLYLLVMLAASIVVALTVRRQRPADDAPQVAVPVVAH
ncbi:MFS transporter [Actinomadura craniellae]|uniref:MFS transporter n=1 Tax=Actinomadura craniellae TaxID=2231787 RepID=A0A365HB65_9ACTN|nr:MFS transporter [Actinomadura craniellae]RAY16325.1 MFS transporter [Actinomadura craniellae]